MKNVLVTGADGFIGSHLTEMLAEQQLNVRALALYNSFSTWGWLDEIDTTKNIEVVTGDIRDPYFCRSLCRDVDTVFHLAALCAIPFSYMAPYSFVDTNVTGTLNLCTAAVENGVQRFVHTSTSEVYGTAQYIPIDEKHPLQPQSPYSASKIAADNLALSYYYAFQLPVVVARPFNTFGPRQSARAVIPTMITQILSGRQEVALGDTSPIRDFNYVEDTCRGLIDIAFANGALGEVFNIGSGVGISIRETFDLIRDLTQSRTTLVVDKSRFRPHESEVRQLVCDSSKLFRFSGYRPGVSLEEGLKRTIDWFRKPENLRKYKADIYNV